MSQPFSSWLGSIDEADILVTATDSMDMPLLPTTPLEASTIATSDSPFGGADSTLAAASARQQAQPVGADAAESQVQSATAEASMQQSLSVASDAPADLAVPVTLPSQQISQAQTPQAEAEKSVMESGSIQDSSIESRNASSEDLPASSAGVSVSEQHARLTKQSGQVNEPTNDRMQAVGTSEALQKTQVRLCKPFCSLVNMVASV